MTLVAIVINFFIWVKIRVDITTFVMLCHARIQRRGGANSPDPYPLENHKWLEFSEEILVRTPFEKGVRKNTVKYFDD